MSDDAILDARQQMGALVLHTAHIAARLSAEAGNLPEPAQLFLASTLLTVMGYGKRFAAAINDPDGEPVVGRRCIFY